MIVVAVDVHDAHERAGNSNQAYVRAFALGVQYAAYAATIPEALRQVLSEVHADVKRMDAGATVRFSVRTYYPE